MGWNYPDISLEEMVKLTKGFVDILILASGYQSSGLLAHWDPHNIKKAIHWGSFFENVLTHMNGSVFYRDSIQQLDAALCEITSDPSFPQGLANLSCDTLSRGRSLVLAHLFQTLPLRDSHLRAFLTAVIEMDLDKILESEHDCLSVYLNNLTVHNVPLSSVAESRGSLKDSIAVWEDNSPTMKVGKCADDNLTKLTLRELFKRRSAVSCILTVQTGLDILSNAINSSGWAESNSSLFKEQRKLHQAPASGGSIEQWVDFVTWNHWKSKIISYFLHQRTIRLVSGARMIFSAPKIQWLQVLDQLNTSAECNNNDLSEIIELLLLGCIASKWDCIVEYFTSVSYDFFTISKLYYEVCSVLPGRSRGYYSKEKAKTSKEGDIFEYLARLLDDRLHPLWKLPPVVAAVAIPSWSPIFRLYLSEIETQFKGDSSILRCCSCIQDRKQHGDCELAERIWCLYTFHACGPNST